jgi:hypothetical protein
MQRRGRHAGQAEGGAGEAKGFQEIAASGRHGDRESGGGKQRSYKMQHRDGENHYRGVIVAHHPTSRD